MARLKRDTRFGLAVSLSFVILVTVIVMSRGKAKTGKTPPTVKITQNNAPPQSLPPTPQAPEEDESDEEWLDLARVEPSSNTTALPPVVKAPTPESDTVNKPALPPLDKMLLAAERSARVPKPGEEEPETSSQDAPPKVTEAANPKVEAKSPTEPLAEPLSSPLDPPPATVPPITESVPTKPEIAPAAAPATTEATAPAAPSETQPMPTAPPTVVEPAVPVTSENKEVTPPAAPTEPMPTTAVVPDAPAQPTPNPSPVAPAPAAESAVPPTPSPATPAPTAPSTPNTPVSPAVEAANSPNAAVVPNTAAPGVKPEAAVPSEAPPSSPPATEPVPSAAPSTEPRVQEPSTKANPASAGQEDWVVIPNVRSQRTGTGGLSESPEPLAALESNEPIDSGVIDRDRVEALPHVVQRGENFWTISRKYYQTPRYWKALWAANRQKVPAADQLYIGTTIRVPPPELLDRTLVEPPMTVRPATSSGPSVPLHKTSRPVLNDEPSGTQGSRKDDEAQVLTLPLDDSFSRPVEEREEWEDPEPSRSDEQRRRRVYKVRPYDTLRTIARDTLNDPRRADEILELNEDVIDNPRHLIPGQIIELPDDARVPRRLR